MPQVDDIDVFRRPSPMPKVEILTELPPTGIAVFDDPCRVREGDLLPPLEERIEAKIPSALRGIDLGKISSRAELMEALTSNIPVNEYQMPKFIYRADLLDVTLFAGNPADMDNQDARYREMQEMLSAAILPLSYHEGYAAFADGRPIWDKLEPFEDTVAYELFQKYLDLPGARQLALLNTTTTNYGPAEGRASTVVQLFHTNYWLLRAKASDVFAVVHAKRVREQRILKTEDKHFLKAEELFTKLMKWADKLDWDALEGDPEKFVTVMEKLVKIQRTALGLSVHGNAKDEDAKVPSVELIMRSLSRQATEGLETVKEAEADVSVQKLLEDPKALEQAQELILRFGGMR